MHKNSQSNDMDALRERRLKQVPPRRPSDITMNIYEQAVQQERSKNSAAIWGLLGCTPEIRTLAGKYKSKLICIDHDPDVFSAYLPLCKPSEYEEFLYSDWLELDNYNNFDLVFGDGSMSMLPIAYHQDFLKSVYQILKPGGLAILRIFTYGKSVFENPEDILEWYQKNMLQTQIDFATMFYFNFLWIDPVTLRTSPDTVKTNFKQLLNKDFLKDTGFREMEQIDYGRVHLQYTLKELFESQAANYFQIESINYPEDYPDYRNTPMYCLRKTYANNGL